jgi:hypothetical protein
MTDETMFFLQKKHKDNAALENKHENQTFKKLVIWQNKSKVRAL